MYRIEGTNPDHTLLCPDSSKLSTVSTTLQANSIYFQRKAYRKCASNAPFRLDLDRASVDLDDLADGVWLSRGTINEFLYRPVWKLLMGEIARLIVAKARYLAIRCGLLDEIALCVVAVRIGSRTGILEAYALA